MNNLKSKSIQVHEQMVPPKRQITAELPLKRQNFSLPYDILTKAMKCFTLELPNTFLSYLTEEK